MKIIKEDITYCGWDNPHNRHKTPEETMIEFNRVQSWKGAVNVDKLRAVANDYVDSIEKYFHVNIGEFDYEAEHCIKEFKKRFGILLRKSEKVKQ